MRGRRMLWAAMLGLLSLHLHGATAHALDFSDVDAAARDAIVSGEIPGAVILIGRGERILYHRAFGDRRLVPNRQPMTIDTVFDIASLTKPLGTTIAVLSLAERGRLSLDALLGRYLREFAKPAFAKVTIRQMLTHRAGFPAVPPETAVRVRFPRAARRLADLGLEYAPGTAFQYSDTGYILLGEVVRRVSGERLDRYLRRIMIRPLRLSDTAFLPGPRLRARTAPTEFVEDHWLQGEVHDARARLLGGVAGHAGMFSSARDIARICRALLARGALDGRRVLRAATVKAMWTPWPGPDSPRGLGWDVSSQFARPMGPYFPAGSVGHTGFTGTAVWMDPETRTYMIVLTNRVHTGASGTRRIQDLRTRVAAAVGAELFGGTIMVARPIAHALDLGTPAADPPGPAPAPVQSGLDGLVRQHFALLAGHTVGLVTNQTGIDSSRRRAIDLLAAAPGVRLKAIFSPEHGLAGNLDTTVSHSTDAVTGLPVWSLYSSARRPSPDMLRGLTAIVFDVQDVGARYYTYLTTLLYVMEEAARLDIPVVVLDRPNPITGRIVEGPLADPDLRSFTAPHPIPVRTGLTIGEFARLSAAERKIPVRLTVVPLDGWTRGQWFDETGLPWSNPSPNIRSLTQALLYSGIGLLESTNLSVGRGTREPFEVVGAPWIEPHGLAQALNDRGLPGVFFEPVSFTPIADVHAAVLCLGVRIHVTDRDAIRPVAVALAIARELRARHRGLFRAERIQHLLVNRSTIWALLRSEPLDQLLAWAEVDHTRFLARRAPYLIYR
jgi:uncharacterized protein YbbC (DUF1343 family)/CubicO group peptidase (beta-lactamase class C family)